MTALPDEKAWINAASRPILELSIYCAEPYLPEFFYSKIIIPKDRINEISNICVPSSE
jgi:hypothetical protein